MKIIILQTYLIWTVGIMLRFETERCQLAVLCPGLARDGRHVGARVHLNPGLAAVHVHTAPGTRMLQPETRALHVSRLIFMINGLE